MRTLLQFAAVAGLGAAALRGQTTLDSSGNSMLKGNYRFRQVAVLNADQNGNPTEVAAAFGVITFDGAGNYSVTGGYVDNTISKGAPQTFPPTTGTYSIGSNGLGFVASPLFPTSDQVFGSVAQGVFTGTDNYFGDLNDIFIAIPVSTPLTNAAFSASYQVGLLDFTAGSSAATKNALFTLSPNGSGGFASISLAGQAANQSATTINQTVTGATYNFGSDGNATLNIPLPTGVTSVNALFTGAKSMFVSSDGNFVLGWSGSGYDIFFGVRALTAPATNATFTGLYYTSALEDTPSGNGTDSYYGSTLAARGDGNEIVHEWIAYYGYSGEDLVTDDATQLNSNGTTAIPDYNGYQLAFGAGGKAYVGVGTGGQFSLLVGLQAPAISGSGVFLSPIGVFNAANYAPVTASIAPGELITLFGSGLAPSPMSAAAGQVPKQLNGVQVLMNNQPVPVFYVSSSQISAIVPYSLGPSSTQSVANIQVNNNGTISNSVQMILTDALPGIFTQNQTGLGYAAVLHNADYSLVTPNNPAKIGEYIQVYLTGLGTVTPTVQDGAPGPTNPLSNADVNTSQNMAFYFDDFTNGVFKPQAVQFAGLAPGYAGLYQVNVQVPSGIGPGDIYLEIATDYADVFQVKIPVASSSGVNARPEAQKSPATPLHSRPLPGNQRPGIRTGASRPALPGK